MLAALLYAACALAPAAAGALLGEKLAIGDPGFSHPGVRLREPDSPTARTKPEP